MAPKPPLRLDRQQAPPRQVRLHPGEATITRRWRRVETETDPAFLCFPLAPDATASGALAEAFVQTGQGRDPVSVLFVRPGTASLLNRTDEDGQARGLDAEEAELARRRRALAHHARLAQRHISESWASPNPPTESWTAFFRHYRAEATRVAEDELRLRARRRAYEMADPPAAPEPEAEVRLGIHDEGQEGTLVVELTYRSALATWTPSYELRFEPDAKSETSGRFELVSVAHVTQTTGEDWTDVDLRLCTAPLPEPSPAPRLARIVVSGFQGPPLAPSMGAEPSPEIDSGPTLAREYRPAGPVRVPGDGRPARIELSRSPLPCRVSTELRTEGAAAAWRIADAAAPNPLPAARALIFDRGAYVGQIGLTDLVAGDPLRVTLGVETGLAVRRFARRPPPRRSKGTNRLEHRFEVTLEVEDIGRGAVDLDVVGRVPVAGSRDVDIEIHELPPGTVVDPKTGYSRSVLRLPERGKRRVAFAFSIHAPRNVSVEGPAGE